MKIFNWVHRKFHHKDWKKAEFVTTETETRVLLQNVTLPVAYGWRDNILSIGTFGFDPFSEFCSKFEYPVEEEDDDEEEEECDGQVEQGFEADNGEESDEEGEEVKPLVFTAFGSGFEREEKCSYYDENAMKADLTMAFYGSSTHIISMSANEVGCDSDKLMRKNDKRERTTLADLFSADSDHVIAKRDQSDQLEPDFSYKKPADLQANKGLSFAKKLLPRVKKDTRPIKKLHLLMKRMLKRKIHPDLEEKIQKDSEITPAAICGLLADQEHGPNESISLLQSGDAI